MGSARYRHLPKALCLALTCLLCLSGFVGSALPAGWFCPLPNALASEAIPFYQTGSELVFITATGECYHSVPDCRGMETAYEVSLEEALRLGYRACSNCKPSALSLAGEAEPFPEDATLVYFTIGSKTYHKNATCKGKTLPCAITLDEAEYLEKTPCKNCKPPE